MFKLILFIVLQVILVCHSQTMIENNQESTTTKMAMAVSKNVTKKPAQNGQSYFDIQDSIIKIAVMMLSKFPQFTSQNLVSIDSKEDEMPTNHFVNKFLSGTKNEDVELDFKKLISKYGFQFIDYAVTTEDGYVLSLFRIPSKGPVVFLMHGFLGSADDFIVAGSNSGLAYALAKKGYDVWLGNARGSKHSRRHLTLFNNSAPFWDFSWHEIGIYDLPAMIDYVLHVTNKTSLKYIGYSQGTTSFFVLVSERPEYNKKISLMVALSPVAFMGRMKSPVIRLMSPFILKLPTLSRNLGVYEFLPNNDLIKLMRKIICGEGSIEDIVCNSVLFLVFGIDFPQLNVTNLPVIFGHLPAGGSVKQFAHYGQGFVSGDFRKYDYGTAENTDRYKSVIPPVYKLQNILTPISIFFSDNDWLADSEDVAYLSYRLRNVVDIYKIPYKGFNHLDFIIAKDVKQLVYTRVLTILSTF